MVILRKKIFLICLFLLFVPFSLLPAEKIRLAVLNLKPENIDHGTAALISDLLRTELFSTGLFRVIERTEMQKILQEQSFQLSGCTETACAVEIGRLLSAQKILVGNIGLLGNKYTISTRIIDIESGEVNFADYVQIEFKNSLDQAVHNLAYRLADKIKETIYTQEKKTNTIVKKTNLPPVKMQTEIQ